MEKNNPDLLNEELFQQNIISRKKLLPTWIKVFTWIFLVISAFIPFVFVLGLMGNSVELSIYGLETNEAFSIFGIIIMMIFLLKGITAIGLLKEKDWAIKLGIFDAVVGIAICILVMLLPIFNANIKFMLRLELVVLIPYLLKLLKIQPDWESFVKV